VMGPLAPRKKRGSLDKHVTTSHCLTLVSLGIEVATAEGSGSCLFHTH
jgi:hypothetical protein